MLGLPSTTEVGRRLPKEAFYRNLKLDAACRKARQINRKNKLFAQLKARRYELELLEGETHARR